ncbi:hypothetical protein SCP_0311770 [Sparassis crispa]|uniref:Uncharacterized protein n=1 Tax=Sparassis crispa TaxID=139825 RepID=A0A401GH02_9APHY|nr:hypothetical protein SCP_0311770 [Sparassis crispa]GBE81448.1 hypothetical protein SCP_0311770 [Sparassis crispa]
MGVLPHLTLAPFGLDLHCSSSAAAASTIRQGPARVGRSDQSEQFSMNTLQGAKTDTTFPLPSISALMPIADPSGLHVVKTTTTDSRCPPENNTTDGCTFVITESSVYNSEAS